MSSRRNRFNGPLSGTGSRAGSLALVAAAAISLATTSGCSAQEPKRAGEANVATPQSFWAKVKAGGPGEVIVLGEGDYGAVKFYGKKVAAPGLRLEAKPGAKVTFSDITVEDSEGIEIRGVEVAIGASQYGVNVGSSSRIKLAGLKIHALGKTPSSAMMLRDSQDVSVSDCDISDVGTGINFLDSDHIKISGTNFHNLQIDAIRGASSHVEVVGNRGSSFHPSEGDHPDFIQFWGSSKNGGSTGNVIKDNVFERGDGAVVQGIFIEDNQDIVITGNAMVGTMFNGVSLSSVRGALVENNFVQGYSDMGSRIIIRGASSNVVVRGNVAESIVNFEEGGKPNPGYKEEHNTSIRAAKLGDTSSMQAWLSKHAASQTNH